MSSNRPIFSSSTRRDPVPRILSGAALGVSLLALLFSMTGMAPASATPTAKGNAGAKQTAAAKKKHQREAGKHQREAREKNTRLQQQISSLKLSCPVSGAIDLGSYCLEGSTYKVPTAEVGQNNYLWATQKCVAEGGWLPTAAQLIGAAPEVALKSTIDDDPGTSGASEFPEAANGIKDEREMTSDLFTTASGGRAAGTEGVTAGSKGVGNLGEPNPVPMPAEPLPESLDYVTVYDNHNMGGFAGGEPVGKAENFRCAYAKGQGKPRNISSRS
jgi:hypothetical protein